MQFPSVVTATIYAKSVLEIVEGTVVSYAIINKIICPCMNMDYSYNGGYYCCFDFKNDKAHYILY